MVIVSIVLRAEFRPNEHIEDAPHFQKYVYLDWNSSFIATE